MATLNGYNLFAQPETGLTDFPVFPFSNAFRFPLELPLYMKTTCTSALII